MALLIAGVSIAAPSPTAPKSRMLTVPAPPVGVTAGAACALAAGAAEARPAPPANEDRAAIEHA